MVLLQPTNTFHKTKMLEQLEAKWNLATLVDSFHKSEGLSCSIRVRDLLGPNMRSELHFINRNMLQACISDLLLLLTDKSLFKRGCCHFISLQQMKLMIIDIQ